MFSGALPLQRGMLMLEQLLVALTPKETTLLPNYLNPFNPETWIPYQLAVSSGVNISIYSGDGILVRTLALGHQPTGVYESRSRAAYWDGKNAQGEPVASGVYAQALFKLFPSDSTLRQLQDALEELENKERNGKEG